MKSFRNFIIILLLFIGVAGYFGSMAWRSLYKVPHARLNETRTKLQQQIEQGKKNLLTMQQTVNGAMTYYSRSFPLDRVSAQTQYQLWLIQLAEFCDMKQTNVTIGEYRPGKGYATEQFRLRTQCSMEELYRFLYEFYWTSWLHRINSMDIQSIEKSELLDVSLVIEGLTLAKPNPQFAWPLVNQFPLSTAQPRRLASGPFKAYEEVGQQELFRYSTPGIDNANYVILTGTPSVTDPETDKTIVLSRWKLETEGRVLSLKIGDRLSIGSFEGTIEDIHEEMVIVRQSSGIRWIVSLGERLSDAVAVPF